PFHHSSVRLILPQAQIKMRLLKFGMNVDD
ncbi:MAG: hypothetical protein ACI81T_003879, partial [Bacteroidia bacterium]